MSRRSAIGFDRRVDLDWLDAAAAQVAAGRSAGEVRVYLWNLLDGVLEGNTSRSARHKTLTVLSHVWADVPSNARGLRDRAAGALVDAAPNERIALHWAMMLGTYPVFTDTATAVGRLLVLQGSFSLAHLTRRLVDGWGERSTVVRAAQRIVRSMVQWGVLVDTGTRGVYERSTQPKQVRPEIGTVLVEALLVDAEESSLPIDQLVGHAALFPFALNVSADDLRRAPQFEMHRQGLDVDVVGLRGGSAGR